MRAWVVQDSLGLVWCFRSKPVSYIEKHKVLGELVHWKIEEDGYSFCLADATNFDCPQWLDLLGFKVVKEKYDLKHFHKHWVGIEVNRPVEVELNLEIL